MHRGGGQQHLQRRADPDAQLLRVEQPAWTITQISAGKYKVVNVASGKALDLNGGSTNDNTALVQNSYSGASSQQWSMLSLSDQAGNYAISPAAESWWSIAPVLGGSADGLSILASGFSTTDSQKWQITPL